MPRRIDPIEHAHLRDARGFSPPVHRFAPSPALEPLVRRFWMPVWSLPAGEVSVQRVLQYPVCQVVVAPDYARLVGPHTGLAEQRLTGSGWVVGAMLQPGAGYLVLGAPLTAVTDGHVDLAEVPGLDGPALAAAVRDAVGADPADPARQRAALAAFEHALAALPPMDAEGALAGAVVDLVEERSDVRRVGQLCDAFGLGERALQRLCARRLGLGPKWLIQRRRLQDVATALRADDVQLSRVAAELGYTDQAHLTTDFRRITGMTPGEFAAEPTP